MNTINTDLIHIQIVENLQAKIRDLQKKNSEFEREIEEHRRLELMGCIELVLVESD